ncbi:MAG TPA: ABC transporter ATP-binding protein [Streptosporangiaceae bacterium]|nr:ABC transporter ATP-binding protein [Streptosporangiaceae bacterium]
MPEPGGPAARAADAVAAGPQPRPGSAGPAAGRGPAVISVRGLRMSYGHYEAVRGIDLEVARGEIFAFLGPNGAGKTTTVEILEGFRTRTGGEVQVLGADPAHAGAAWRARSGVVLQESAPEAWLTVRECVSMYAGYYPNPLPVGRALDLVGLTDKAGGRCDRLSGGQLRRLDMALALIGDPELVFLDEPTTGFDPSARHAAWEVISGLRDLGKTIFLTTHYMEEAETLADQIMIIAAGKIVASGTPATIGGRARESTTVSFTLPDGLTPADLPSLPAPVTEGRNRTVEIVHHEPLPVLHAVTSWALQRGYPLSDLSVHRPTLEEIYLRLTEGQT